jgi:hypothetical protein
MRFKSLAFCFALLVIICSPNLLAQTLMDNSSVESSLSRLPMVFEPNRGQADTDVHFLLRGSAYTLFLEPDRAVFAIPAAIGAVNEGHMCQPSIITLELLGANNKAVSKSFDSLPGKSNYYIGKQSAKWISGIPQYGKVGFKSIYSGIDVVYYGNEGNLEYDFIVLPGADPKKIAFRTSGVDNVDLDEHGNLHLRVSNGTIELHKPIIYQETAGIQHLIDGKFVFRGERDIGLEIGKYDVRKRLIIDPALGYSTLIGANNNTQVQGIAVDALGNVYITGTTFATNYPTVKAFQPQNNGYTDVFVTKLSPAGNVILYSTYLGGSGFDTGRAIAVDSAGSAYVTGNIGGGDFPTTPGAFMTTCPGICNTPFVTKFLTDGTLAFSTYMGGSNVGAWAIAVDSAGAAYITGTAASNDLPTTPGSFEPVYPGGICTNCYNGYVEKLNAAGTGLIYSTYFGAVPGPGLPPSTAASGIAVDSAGAAYLVGNTTAIPVQNPIQPSIVGGPNAFIAKFSPDGSSLVLSTYLGGTSPFFFSYAGDYATGVAVDSLGNVHVTGTSCSCEFPLSLNALSTDCVTTGYDQKVFVVTLNSAGTQILFSTFLRSGAASGIALDKKGNSYVTGTTTSDSFPVLNPIESTSQQASSTSFVTELDISGKLLFSTYLGASSPGAPGFGSQAAGIAVDSKGGIYVSGAGQGDFPLLHPIPSQVKQNTYYTLFVAKISPKSAPQFSLSPRVSPVLALRNVSSVPLTISAITHSSNFTQGGNCGTSLAPGTGCTLILEGAADKKTSGTVTITSNAYSKPQRFVISKSPYGDNVGSIVTVFPIYLQFPSQLIGTTSPAQQIVIENSGLLPAAIDSILMIQPSAFNETNNCPPMLNAASSCAISVTYTPVSAQDSAQLAIVTDPSQTRYTAFLSGFGSTSAIAVSTSSVQFGSQFVGAAPLGRMVNLTNTTPYPASITSISTSTGFAQTNTCTAPLAPQASCRASVTYTPSTNENATGTLAAAGYGPGGAQTVNLQATGINPGDLGLSPVSLSFVGYVGYASGPYPVTVTNNSQKTITIQNVTVSGPFSQTNNCPGTIAPASTCQISVSFNPKQVGAANGTLQVTFVGAGSPQTIALTGSAQTAVQFSPSPVQFGQQPVNVSGAPVGVGLDNFGSTMVNLSNFNVQGSDFAIVQNSCGKALAGHTGCGLQIVFTPSGTGTRTGTLAVTVSGYSQAITAALQGTGISNGIGSLSATSLDFGIQAVGTQSQPQSVTLTNTGTAALKLNSIAASPQFFTQTNTCGSSLAAGASCTISIIFTPSLQGILVGALSVQDDGAGSPHAVALSGIGQ